MTVKGCAQTGTPHITKFGAWVLRCEALAGAGNQQCALIQTVHSEENANVSVAAIFRKSPALKNGIFEVIAPEGVLLPEGIKFKIDQSDVGQLPFMKCISGGCLAETVLDDNVLEKLNNGRVGLVTIYVNPGEGLRHVFSLDGFKDGWEALK